MPGGGVKQIFVIHMTVRPRLSDLLLMFLLFGSRSVRLPKSAKNAGCESSARWKWMDR